MNKKQKDSESFIVLTTASLRSPNLYQPRVSLSYFINLHILRRRKLIYTLIFRIIINRNKPVISNHKQTKVTKLSGKFEKFYLFKFTFQILKEIQPRNWFEVIDTDTPAM